MPEISKITLPSGSTYDIKDASARQAIANIHTFNYSVCTQASDTPYGVTWDNGGTSVTGTLVASSETMYKIYLVPKNNAAGDYYDEYITVNPSGTTYNWEKFGSTQIDIDNLGDFAYADTGSVTVTPSGSNADSSVSFESHTTVSVLKDTVTATVPKTSSTTKYMKPSVTAGSTSKLVTASKYVAESSSAGCVMPSYTMGTGNDAETLIITGGTAPSFASQTIATGSLSSEGSGDTVVTGQPSVTLSTDTTTSTGAVAYTESVSESGTNSVTFETTNNTANAITALGAATAAGQTFTGTSATYTVSPVTE